MSKTIDELVKVYIIAHFGADNGPRNRERYRAGIAAVIRAVRDEIVEDGNCKYCVATTAMYNEIIGDAGEKNLLDAGSGGRSATSETTSGDVANAQGEASPRRVVPNSPATAPAPAVCVWQRDPEPVQMVSACGYRVDCSPYFFVPTGHCPSCGLPIKFTEAK